MRVDEWQSLSLEFPEPSMEKKWTEQYSNDCMALDAFTLSCYVVCICLAALVQFEGTAPLTLTFFCYFCIIEHLALLAFQYKRRDTYRRWRFPLLTAHKGLMIAMGVNALSRTRSPPKSNWLQFFGHDILLMNKLGMVLFAGWALTLKLKQHLFAQSFMVIIGLQHNAALCRMLQNQFPGNAEKYLQVVKVLDSLFLVDTVMPDVRRTGEDCCEDRLCRRVQTFFQVAMGFILPCIYAYVTELQSRNCFLQVNCGQLPPQRKTLWEHCTSVILHGTQIYVLTSLLWHATGWITGGWRS